MLNEATFQNRIILFATRCGVLAVHHYAAWSCTVAGVPDLILVGPGGVLWAELKSQAGTLSVAQMRFARRLGEAGAEYQCWVPDDWHCGRVQREIERLSLPPVPAQQLRAVA